MSMIDAIIAMAKEATHKELKHKGKWQTCHECEEDEDD